MSKTKHTRRRPTREEVRRNARRSGGKQQFLNLPRGVREWAPEKAGSYLIDVLPYEVTTHHHPDGVDKGTLWYKYPFHIHRDIGASQEQVVCPTSVGKPCPICEHRAKLIKDGRDRDDETVRALNYQDWVVYNIIDPDDPEAVALLSMSKGKFAKPLEKELNVDDAEDYQLFFDVTDDGRTLKVRFSDATFDGRKFLEATRIDFRERKAMDEDEVLGKVVCLDTCLNVLPYDKLKALFLQVENVGEDEDDSEEREDESDKEESGDKGAEWEKGDHVKFKKGKKELDGYIVKITGDGAVVKTDDGEKYTIDLDDLEAVVDDEPTVEDDEEEEEEEGGGEEEDEAEEDEEEEEEAEEDEEEEEEEEKPKAKGKPKGKAEDKAKGKPKSKGKCPHGHKFGIDVDKHKECGDCKVWEECDEASTTH